MFRATLPPLPFEIEIEREQGLLRAFVEVASDGERIVAVVCELADINVVYAEFSFSIAIVSLDESHEPFQTQDRQIAAAYIPDGVKHRIMPLVCHCLERLIADRAPDGVYRVVKERNPPDKSLSKHNLLTQVLESAGYSVENEGTDPHERRFCTMRRNTP